MWNALYEIKWGLNILSLLFYNFFFEALKQELRVFVCYLFLYLNQDFLLLSFVCTICNLLIHNITYGLFSILLT